MLTWLLTHPYLGYFCANAVCALLCWSSVLAHYVMLGRLSAMLVAHRRSLGFRDDKP